VVAVEVTLAPVLALKVALGVQVYVLAPETDTEVEPVIHFEPLTGTRVGVGLTVTVPVAVAVQPAALVPVTV
jgi:hypothetical protein